MRQFYSYLFFALMVLLLFNACDSINAPDCLKTTGDIVTREYDLAPFHTIIVLDEADIYLGNAYEQQVEIIAGKNLIPEIHFEVIDSVMTIRNDNSCNWRRAPGNPGIYINTDRLRSVEIYDYAGIYTQDSLSLKKLMLYSDGTGNFDLSVSVDSLIVASIYISNFTLSGRAGYLEISFRDDSRFDGKDLISRVNRIHHNGSNLIELFPVKELTGELLSTGSLCYYHKPDFLDVEVNHAGRLMDCTGN